MSYKPVIGVFLKDENELNKLIRHFPYCTEEPIIIRSSMRNQYEYEHFVLNIFFNFYHNIKGIKFSNIVMSEQFHENIILNKIYDECMNILGTCLIPCYQFGASINIIRI